MKDWVYKLYMCVCITSQLKNMNMVVAAREG